MDSEGSKAQESESSQALGKKAQENAIEMGDRRCPCGSGKESKRCFGGATVN
jgi:uncharacterized protein YchJ